MPQGARIIEARPSYSIFSPEKAEANWLLANTKPGTINIRCRLDDKVDLSRFHAVLRFKNPKTAGMEELGFGP